MGFMEMISIKQKLKNCIKGVFLKIFAVSRSSQDVSDGASSGLKKTKSNMESPLSLLAGLKGVPAIYLKNIYGQRILLDPRDLYLTLHYLEHRDWEDHLHKVYSSQSKGALYIDVGANVGLHVLRAHMLGMTEIIAFEPDPLTFELLRQNVSINGGYEIELHQAAVGTSNGTIGFSVDQISTGMSRVDSASDFMVDLIRLDDLKVDASLHDSLLLKIDVEGLEGDVIAGALNLITSFARATLVIEFGSQSSIDGVSSLLSNEEWLCDIYPWRDKPYAVSRDELRQWEKPGVVDLIMRKGFK